LENSDGNVYLIATSLADAVKQACNLESARKSLACEAHNSSAPPSSIRFSIVHPRRAGKLRHRSQGTGAVHTAPAHGVDDFYTGERYGLSQVTKVDAAGRIQDGLPEYNGLNIFKANPEIIKLLEARGALLARNDIYHSYPHCWRCHNPVIYRATEQWFISMETPDPASRWLNRDVPSARSR